MKVLSIKQPWIELILLGRKTVEFRSWTTDFRGEFLLHSSKKPDLSCRSDLSLDKLEYGKIIGIAELVDVEDFGDGQYGFHLSNVRRIKSISHNGLLYFWNYEGEIEYV